MQPVCFGALRAAEGMLVAGARSGQPEVRSGLEQLLPLRTCNQTNTGLPCAAICRYAIQVVSEIACEVCSASIGCERDPDVDKAKCFKPAPA